MAFMPAQTIVPETPIPIETPIIIETPTTTPQVAYTPVSGLLDTYCSCVLYTRTKIPTLPRGDAWMLKPNTDFPQEGGVVIFSYNHIAYIEAVTTTRIKISEANKSRCRYGERFLNINDPSITGFWYPPQLSG